MRRVTARELRQLRVGHGNPLPLPMDPVEVAKAQFLDTLEKLYGDDLQLWIQALKHAKQKIRREPYRTALDQILKETAEQVKNG